LLVPFVAARGRKAAKHMREASILAILLSILYIAQTVGLKYTTATNSAFITGLFVVFVPLFLFLFARKRLVPSQWAALVLAVGGLWLLTGGVSKLNYGDLLTLMTAVTYAGHLLVTDACVRADADPVLLAFHQFWMTGLISLAYAWQRGVSLSAGSFATMKVVGFLAVFPTLTAFYVQLVAQKKTTALKVSLIFLLEPVFAALFAWTLGGETFVLQRAAGAALILAAMLTGELGKLGLLRGRRKEILPA
jgi:drug/metabolite transporter (DMT)-like permease